MNKISQDFFYSDICCSIRNLETKRAGLDLVREAIFLRLLISSADGRFFSSDEHFIAQMGARNQAKLVWDYCLTNNILSQTEHGYTAIEWMIQRNLADVPNMQNFTSLAHVSSQTHKTTYEGRKRAKTGKISQENAMPEGGPQPASETSADLSVFNEDNRKSENVPETQVTIKPKDELKECVRPNVFLSRSEILDLKSRFTDDQITLMLDKLSEYKTTTNRLYKSDFDAIERWVIKWLNSTNTQQKQSMHKDANIEYPSWLTGK